MARSDAHNLVRDLLRLRRWAVEVLSHGDPQSSHSIADIQSEAWLLFLSLERCAGVLLSRLAESSELEGIDTESADMLRAVAAGEAQSALGARVDGKDIAAIAERVGFPVVVLKGGVRAIAGAEPSLPVVDIDLLVQQGNVTALVDEIQAAGLGQPTRRLEHHQGLLPQIDRLAVEVHWTTHDDGKPLDPLVWERLRPIESVPPLLQLGARDNVVHLLEHAVFIHRERSVSLRDTILIGISAAECSESEIEDIRRAVARDTAMTQLLSFAIALQSRQSVSDPFIESCATFYSALALIGQVPLLQRSSGAMAFVTELELGRIPSARSIRNTLRWRGTGIASLGRVADRFSGIGPLILAPVRLGYYSLVAAVTIPAIRRTRRSALISLEQQNVRVSS